MGKKLPLDQINARLFSPEELSELEMLSEQTDPTLVDVARARLEHLHDHYVTKARSVEAPRSNKVIERVGVLTGLGVIGVGYALFRQEAALVGGGVITGAMVFVARKFKPKEYNEHQARAASARIFLLKHQSRTQGFGRQEMVN